MSLNIQIKTIILSILYGIFIYYFLLINKKIIYNKSIVIKIIGTLSIMILITLLFFLLLININNGYIHIYEFVLIILSIALLHKRWYNFYGDNMSKKVSKKAKKRLVIFGIPCVIIIMYFLLQLLMYSYKIYNLKVTQHKLDVQMENLKSEEKEKRNEIEKLSTEDGIANYAREEFSYSKNGEYKIKIKEKDKKEEKDLSFTEFLLDKVKNFDYDYAYIIVGIISIIVIVIIMSSKKKD